MMRMIGRLLGEVCKVALYVVVFFVALLFIVPFRK